jgi:hypothetical protein
MKVKEDEKVQDGSVCRDTLAGSDLFNNLSITGIKPQKKTIMRHQYFRNSLHQRFS